MTMRAAIATSDTGSGVEQLNLRVALVAVSVAFYALTFILLHAELGPGIVSLGQLLVALDCVNPLEPVCSIRNIHRPSFQVVILNTER